MHKNNHKAPETGPKAWKCGCNGAQKCGDKLLEMGAPLDERPGNCVVMDLYMTAPGKYRLI